MVHKYTTTIYAYNIIIIIIYYDYFPFIIHKTKIKNFKKINIKRLH